MKLALVRAMLQKADILLLDEPTNHLDVHNVAWLQNYLVSLDKVGKRGGEGGRAHLASQGTPCAVLAPVTLLRPRPAPQVTSIIVSHDSTFLDFVCTHILHYESRKLRAYRGNLSEFVKQKPEVRGGPDTGTLCQAW